MNEITDFLVRNMIAVYFFYGLAFFTMGLALAMTRRETSRLRFARAIPYMAAFGLIHGLHEWYEMGQRIAVETQQHVVGLPEEVVRLVLLVVSFVMLLCFAVQLLVPARVPRKRIFAPVALLVLLWAIASIVFIGMQPTTPLGAIAVADGLARYLLAIPGAALAAWALMREQRVFRAMDLSQFGRDMVWSAAALLLYGIVGQLFVRQSTLPWSAFFNNENFLAWFGIPVQLFRAVMAIALTVFLMRLMNAFAVENRRRLEVANAERTSAQQAAIMAERRNTAAMEAMNDELRLAAHKLSLLLDVSNLLDMPGGLAQRLQQALDRIIQALPFANAGLMVIARWGDHAEEVMGKVGFVPAAEAALTAAPDDELLSGQAVELGRVSIERAMAMCRHTDGAVIEFNAAAETDDPDHKCRSYGAPTTMIAYPVTAHQAVYGSIVLVRVSPIPYRPAAPEMALMAGVAQQLGVSIENALLSEEAQRHERLLGELLRQIVSAQETERQRIARELHDATGQSLTAVGLGLRGVETQLSQSSCDPELSSLATQVKELRTFSQNALGELRNIISDLRPPQLDELGLGAALRWYAQAYARRRAVPVDLIIEGNDDRLPADYRTVLFRIAQESLTNIAKHAHAEQVAVRLHVGDDSVNLEIADDGIGFDPSLPEQLARQPGVGWGVVGMRERALLLGGTCVIDTAPGKGTCVRVTAPLNHERNHHPGEGGNNHE